MANFCNKCGAPVSGIFCVKCGYDTRLAGKPAATTGDVRGCSRQPRRPRHRQPFPRLPACPLPNSATNVAPHRLEHRSAISAEPTCGRRRLRLAPAIPLPRRRLHHSTSASTPVPSQTVSAPQAQGKGSPLTKILIGFAVVVIAVGAMAAGGVYYVVYRVKQKVHEVAHDVPGLGSRSGQQFQFQRRIAHGFHLEDGFGFGASDGEIPAARNNGGISGDPCRLFSKDEVGGAIGVQIVATQSSDAGCSYLAQGNSGDMTAKHMAAMMGTKGADAKTQQMIRALPEEWPKRSRAKVTHETSDRNGNVPVFAFSVDNNSADAQMRLNAKVLGRLGPGQQDIPGIGDQAFDESGAMMMVRKGDKLIRIMYSTCPCSVEAIKPLAKTLADRL